jgi:glucose-6-phosphate 1-dehydrogenase
MEPVSRFSERFSTSQPVSPFDLVLFGATGDLAMRKLMPALYLRDRAQDLHPQGRIIALGRRTISREQYLAKVEEACRSSIEKEQFDEKTFVKLGARIEYQKLEAEQTEDFTRLATRLQVSPAPVRIFYLATAPDLFAPICLQLAKAGLCTPAARVVLEKPIGQDVQSAREISTAVGGVFGEDQTYRIDHYMGKEPVQNLLALRFGNTLFEPLWNRTWVKDVQITIAETLGVEARGEFYNRTGALRDMVQNHLLQLLCIIATEPPSSIDPDAVRDEKLKVLRSLTPIAEEDALGQVVRGQYRAGAADGQPVRGFLEEEGIPPNSQTETFVALKVGVSNWRWAGVPFFLRTGKRMQERVAEIVVNFRTVPHAIFPAVRGPWAGNRLVIRLQPDEGLKLYLFAKAPGDAMNLKPTYLNLDFSEHFQQRPMKAYERLLMDILRGRLTLFMRRDAVDLAWRWVEPILHAWEASREPPKSYTAGTWGPAASSALLAREGSAWHEEI